MMKKSRKPKINVLNPILTSLPSVSQSLLSKDKSISSINPLIDQEKSEKSIDILNRHSKSIGVPSTSKNMSVINSKADNLIKFRPI